jgi:hypothetical protein
MTIPVFGIVSSKASECLLSWLVYLRITIGVDQRHFVQHQHDN